MDNYNVSGTHVRMCQKNYGKTASIIINADYGK